MKGGKSSGAMPHDYLLLKRKNSSRGKNFLGEDAFPFQRGGIIPPHRRF